MKKFISMALALVMTLSLCTFVAAPKAEAAFDDADELSSKYAEQAIDVIQTIEVMSGYDDNTFKPTAGLTRQAAAKIICNMILGPTTAKALPTNASPFPDVLPGTEWAGYISYCLQQKIISGYSDGTFKGGDPLSGYAYLKMLLGALGYDANEEGFVGSNWKVNVAKTALGIGLDKGVSVELDGTTQVTREDAAIYAFNTIQADMVEYESKNTLEINGVKVTMGGSNAVPQTWNTSSTSIDNINNAKSDGNNARPIVQFAERYFDKLVRDPNRWDDYTQDDFGRPSIKWFWKGVEIGTYSREPDAVFVGNPKVNAIYEELNMPDSDPEAWLYINSKVPNNKALDMKRGNDKALDHSSNLLMFTGDDQKDGKTINQVRTDHHLATIPGGNVLVTKDDIGRSMNVYGDGSHRVDRLGNSTLIECFRNEATNHVDVCVISIYGGKIDAVKPATAKKDRYVTVVYAPDDQANHRPGSITGTGRNEFETEDFEEEDYVAYTYSDSAPGIKNMYLMNSESGSLTSRVKEENLKLDDITFYYAKEYAFYEMTEDDLSNKSAYVAYTFRWGDIDKYADLGVDDDEHTLWIEEDEFAVDQYVLIERITIETKNPTTGVIEKSTSTVDRPASTPEAMNSSSWNVEAVVRTASGARRTYALDDSKNYRTANGAAIDNDFLSGHIVRISNNSNGYRLHRVDGKYTLLAVPRFTISGKDILTNGGTVLTDEGKRLIVDSETHFTVEDTGNETYKAYVGTKNVPDVNAPGGTAYIYHRGALAKQVFITSARNVTSSSRDVIFLVAPSTSNLVESDDGNYYDVAAVDKDQITTFRVRAGTAFWENGNYFEPGSELKNTKNEGNCILLNKVTYDSNNLVIGGDFDRTKVTPQTATGIRRINDEEVRFDTGTSESYIRDVSETVRVFFCDGGDIEQIDYADIVNDTKDAIYFVENDNSVVTYIFIVNFEDDGWPAHVAKPTFALNIANNDFIPDDYTVVVNAGQWSHYANAGDTLNFSVMHNGVAVTSDTVQVGLRYTDAGGVTSTHWTAVYNAPNAEHNGYWSVNIPSSDDVSYNTILPTITLVVVQRVPTSS